MKFQRIYRILVPVAVIGGLVSCKFRKEEGGGTRFQEAIEAIEAAAPQTYPEAVVPIPELQDQRSMPTGDLIARLDSWNPPLRMNLAKALAARGKEAIPELVEGSRSSKSTVRAGVYTALAAIMMEMTSVPEGPDSKQQAMAVREKINADYPEAVAAWIRATREEDRDIRFLAAQGLRAMAPQTPEAARALMALWADEDEFVAQEAMITYGSAFPAELVPPQEMVDAIRPAFQSPLPRTRGWAAHIVGQLEPEFQRQLVPELIEHLKWDTMRDTMFARIGPATSVSILTDLRVKELIPMLPELMFKRMHGDMIYIPCLEAIQAYGKDAQVLLPELRRQLADIEAQGTRSPYAPRRDYTQAVEKLRETVDYLDTL